MTQKEQDNVSELKQIVIDLSGTVHRQIESAKYTVDDLKSRVEKKYIPVSFEKEILSTVQSSMSESIEKSLTGYDSPLQKLIKEVISENSPQLKSIISDSFKFVISRDDFKESIMSAFSHKISRSMVSGNDGLFDKVNHSLKSDPTFKAKITLMVSEIVCSHLKEEKK